MKKLVYLSIGIFLLASCGKYEEGPGFSLLSKKNRITNTWNLSSRTTNGQSTNVSNFTWKVVIKDDETYTSQSSLFGVPLFNETGNWKFSSDKKQLVTTPSGSSNNASWEIIRLSKDELKLKYISSGDTLVDTFSGQ
jgi:hypothetical protein